MPTGRLEVHDHCYVAGPRANGHSYRFSHSHEGGDQPHQHPEAGPASYTIDKDEWFRETGLRGGGRKTFTAQPTGEQLPWVELEDWQKTFEVIIAAPTPDAGEGPGLALPMRLILGSKMKVSSVGESGGAA